MDKGARLFLTSVVGDPKVPGSNPGRSRFFHGFSRVFFSMFRLSVGCQRP